MDLVSQILDVAVLGADRLRPTVCLKVASLHQGIHDLKSVRLPCSMHPRSPGCQLLFP